MSAQPSSGSRPGSSPQPFVGIDLGTTISVVSVVDESGRLTTLSNREGDPLTPSAIYLDGQDVVVGKAARDAASHLPDKVALDVKRDMGERHYARAVDGRMFRPETLSALILRKLKQDAERRIGPIARAVITVPAYFDDSRRKATQDAGRIAGFDEVSIINEPTAAALAYCLETHLAADDLARHLAEIQDQRALVYDLGGGTFDVTVIEFSRNQINTRATDGAVRLGGRDWDDRIIDLISQEIRQRHHTEVDDSRRIAYSSIAETAKKLLSQLPSVPVECVHRDQIVRLQLSRESFVDLTRDLLFQTEAITNLVLQQAGLSSWDEVDRVFLVGGSTRMPMVKEMLRRITGREPDDSLDPDQAVSRGAAIFAALQWAHRVPLSVDNELVNRLHEVNVVDVNSHSLGVAARDPKRGQSVNAIVIPKNSPLPVASSRLFRTAKMGATSLRVPILEGEAPEADANILLGECRISDLSPNLPEKSPVQIWLSYETTGRVRVYALEMTGGRLAKAEIFRRAGMSADEVQQERERVAQFRLV